MNNIFVWMIAALSWTAVAHASPITFSFTGTVTDVPVNETTALVTNSSVGLGQNAMANNGTSSVGLATPTDGNVCNTALCP